MRWPWANSDGTSAALSPWQLRAVSLVLLLTIFVLDATTTLAIATAYVAVIGLTFWSSDRWLPMAVSAASVALVFLALAFTDKDLPALRLVTLRAGGSIVFLGTGWLITRHRQLLSASAHRETVLRTIFDSEPACVKLLGPDNTLIEMNRAGLAMIEADSLDAVKGHSVLPLVTPEHRAAFAELTRQVFDGKSVSLQFEIAGLRGTRRWFETHGAPLRDEAGRITAMLAVSHDVTERRRTEDQRDALALRVLEVQEDERRAVARDLHDEIGQALSALKLNLLSLRRDASDPARVIADSVHIVDEVLQQVRDIALSLRPGALDDLGLGAAVQWYVEQTAARTGLDLTCSIAPDLPAASPATEIACFRVLQEALTNVQRHARATQALVRLSWDGANLELVVWDNGAGFSPAATPRDAQTGHLGLIGMRERAALLRGQATVTSAPGAGCEVRVTFPLPVGADRAATGVGI